MLKPLLDINEVQINKADLGVIKNKNIYEVFISLFIKYLDKLIHRGLKSQYILKEDNQFFLKGKLKFNQHIRLNYIHKERFYVEFDSSIDNQQSFYTSCFMYLVVIVFFTRLELIDLFHVHDVNFLK